MDALQINDWPEPDAGVHTAVSTMLGCWGGTPVLLVWGLCACGSRVSSGSSNNTTIHGVRLVECIN